MGDVSHLAYGSASTHTEVGDFVSGHFAFLIPRRWVVKTSISSEANFHPSRKHAVCMLRRVCLLPAEKAQVRLSRLALKVMIAYHVEGLQFAEGFCERCKNLLFLAFRSKVFGLEFYISLTGGRCRLFFVWRVNNPAACDTMESRAYTLLVVCTIFSFSSSVGLVLPLSSIRVKRRSFSVDDFLVLWAYVRSQSTNVPFKKI